MTPLQNLTVEQLRKMVSIKEQIETLQAEIESITGGGPDTSDQLPRRGKMSNLERARIAAAARWAKARAAKGEAAAKKSGRFSAAHRAALAAAQQARWAKVRAAKLKAGNGEQTEPKKRRQVSAAGRARIAAAAKARWAKFRAERQSGQ